MEHGVSTAIATNSDVRKRSTNFGREMLNATVSAWTLLARTFLQIALAQYRKALLLDQFNSQNLDSSHGACRKSRTDTHAIGWMDF